MGQRSTTRATALWVAGLLAGAGWSPAAQCETSAADLAKAVQNPVANLISVPFQDNVNFNVGPQNGTQNVLNIQPVIPISVNHDWNLITRTILPLISQPAMAPGQDRTFGIGDLQLSGFLSPAKPGPRGLIWGAGAVVQAPTDSNGLGNKNWGLGPTVVALRSQAGSPWVVGVLANNIWSLSSDERGGAYSNFLLQYFINYNLPKGTYITSAPIITANWKADGGQRWTVPFGIGAGKIFMLGKQPMNAQVGAYYNVVHPDDAPNWQLRLQLQLLFPK